MRVGGAGWGRGVRTVVSGCGTSTGMVACGPVRRWTAVHGGSGGWRCDCRCGRILRLLWRSCARLASMRLACPSPISRVAGPMSILGCCDPTPGSWADCPQSRLRAVVCAGARPHAALTLQRSLLPQCGASLTVLCCTLHAHQGIVLACPQQRDHALNAEACSATRRSLRPTRGRSRGTLHSVCTLPHMQAPASDEKQITYRSSPSDAFSTARAVALCTKPAIANNSGWPPSFCSSPTLLVHA